MSCKNTNWQGFQGIVNAISLQFIPFLIASVLFTTFLAGLIAWLSRPLREEQIFFFCISLLILISGLIFVINHWLIRPLLHLKEVAQKILTPEQTADKLDLGGLKEIQELGEAFNQIVTQLQNISGELESLRESSLEKENRLIQFLEALPVGVSVHDTTGKTIYLNELAKQLLNIQELPEATKEELAEAFQIYQARGENLYPTEEIPVVVALSGKTFYTEDIEYRFQERVISLEVSAQPIFDRQGNVIYAISAFQEISERKQTEQALRESETRFRNMAANVPGAIFRYVLRADGSDQVNYMNPGCQYIWEVEAEQVQKNAEPLWEMIHTEDLPGMRNSVMESARTLNSWSYEWRIITPSGKLKWLQGAGRPTREPNGDLVWDSLILDVSDRKEVEQQLQNLVNNVPGVIYRYLLREDGSDAMLYVSPNCEEIWELEAAAIEENVSLVWHMVHPEDLPGMRASVLESAHTLEPWSYEWRITTPSGTQKWLRGASKSQPCNNGDVVWDGLIVNISEGKEVEAALQESENKISNILSSISDAFFSVDRDWRFTYMNARAEVILQRQKQELLGKKIWEEFPEAVNLSFYQRYHSCVAKQEPVNFLEYYPPLDMWFEVHAYPFGAGLSVYFQDATERKRTEEELRQSEERYRLLAENINDLVCLHDREGNYLYVSPSVKSLLGYEPQELIGQSPYQFFHPEDHQRIRHESHQAALSQDPVPVTYRMRTKLGNYIWLETLTTPIADAEGKVFHLQTVSRDVSERIKVQEELQYAAFHDILTGLPNRTLLMRHLELALARVKQQKHPYFALLFLDLDRFKVVNDSLGHLIGDTILASVAQRLRNLTQKVDFVARFGGDEFVILLEQVSSKEEVTEVAENILVGFERPLQLEGREIFISASIGIVLGMENYQQPSDLLRDADLAMYQAKQRGRDQYQIFTPPMYQQILKKLHLENALHKALREEEFVLYYQPIINLNTGKLSGFEALVRWQHPSLGFIPPDEFIQIAEEMGLITALDLWVLQEACSQLRKWQKTYPQFPNLKISVNLSVKDLWGNTLSEEIEAILKQTDLNSQHLTLEITESMLIRDFEATIELLARLKETGVRLSMDDFGTGYSSLNYLHRLPIDILKIDRSFIAQMHQEQKNHEIVETIISLSERFGLEVVAEGVETKQQLISLRGQGCKFGQGYLFAAPLPAEEATNFLLQKATTARHA